MRLVSKMLLIAVAISLSSMAAQAEEGLAGHYFPGGVSSSIDLMPAKSDYLTFAYANYSLYYHGSSNVFGTNATTYSNISAFLCQFPWSVPYLPGHPQYAISLAVPYTWLKVHAPAAKDTDNGFGDIEMFPIALEWTKKATETETINYTWRTQTEFGIYAPTGNFERGAAANIGRNYWTFEPSAATDYFLAVPNTEAYSVDFTASVGFDFNTKNGATRYRTGDQFHLDGTLAGYGPLLGGLVSAGVSGFFYQQITGDSGKGAIAGSFEAMTTGVGPDLSYFYQIPAQGLTMGAEVKWLPELSVSNRLSGNIVWLKFVIAWGKPTQASQLAAELAAPPNVRALNIIPAL
ncbi:MAG: transporter [Candidatus Binatus sp.]